MWDYLHFYVLLEEKASTELTGPESYVKKLILVRGSLTPWLYTMYNNDFKNALLIHRTTSLTGFQGEGPCP